MANNDKNKTRETISSSDVASVNVGTTAPLATTPRKGRAILDEQAKNNAALAAYEVTDFDKAILEAIADWEEEQVGFPPYWKPEEVGRLIMGKVLMKDEDGMFPRYVLQAILPVKCQKGSAQSNTVQEVVVQPGQFFTMSVYAGLPLDRFFDVGVVIRVTGERMLPATEESDGKPRDLWEWTVLVHPNDKAKLDARRVEETQRLMQARTVNAPATEAEAS